MKLASICVHGAKDKNNRTGALAVPIYQSATFAHPGVGRSTGYDYARVQNPTREALEGQIAALEGGAEGLAFCSGMAAIDALMELFEPGDHLLCNDDLYGGTVRLLAAQARRSGLAVDYLDGRDPQAFQKALRPKTKAVFIETPSNPMMKITDIRAIRAAVGPEVMLIVDNTFLTPCCQRPLELGADLVVHSGTKYLGGHNDTLAGLIVVSDHELAERLRFVTKTVGSGLSPFDSFLIIRGLKTLQIRMEKSQRSAQAAAEFLQGHPKVVKVRYPGLPSLDREISLSQASGFGSMLAFEVDSEETAKAVLERVEMILYAESLGGAETLITYPLLQTHSDVPEAIRESLGINDRLLRLSLGLEDLDDILADLAQALG
ncbi:MAG: PLP-dependent aspartate aminotransferase family protein [Deltaproteobacteria bacterium]|jgi:cystathionine beta-lyase/cystathionine gamma-synthase|nr:PLP-dependent aspartate aminotransferase family protein [Deltaproteobacteria bacterium]